MTNKRRINKSVKAVSRARKKYSLKKPLPDSVARFLKSGLQTESTNTVKAYAKKFSGKNIETVKKILDDIVSFRRKHLPLEELKKVYAKRSADQILKDRYVVIIARNQSSSGRYASVSGCIDYNVALCAALRAKAIPAKFVREKNHSTTLFYLNGKWYEADPTSAITRRLAERLMKRGRSVDTSNISNLITAVSDSRFEMMQAGKQLGYVAEGLDAWDIGIHSLRNFGKYNPPINHGVR